MLETKTNKENIAKYKETLLLNDLSEQYSKYRHDLKQVLNESPYIILLGDNDFNGLGYFYFIKQQHSKKDCVYIAFSKANKESEAVNIYTLALVVKIKALDSTRIVNLCETLISADEFGKVLVDFDKHLFSILNACGLEYEIAKLK
ncbi:hypothetical protein ACLGDL_07980 [Helicobacter pylori]